MPSFNKYLLNAFVSERFSGNPAAVVLLDSSLSDGDLLSIAKKNMLPETAFILRQDNDSLNLRWFTPDIEMDLCGHATLAAGWVALNYLYPDREEITFSTVSGGITLWRDGELIAISFPLRIGVEIALPESIYNALSIKPRKVYKARDYMLVYDDENDVVNIEIDRAEFDKINLDPGGVVVTAPGRECDFVSRFFTPQATFLEDPVTGSAHCTLAPYWANILGKNRMIARQLSQRGGELICEIERERLILKGKCEVVNGID